MNSANNVVNQLEVDAKIARLALGTCYPENWNYNTIEKLVYGIKNDNKNVKNVEKLSAKPINLIITNGITNMNIDIYFITLAGLIHYKPSKYNNIVKEHYKKETFGYLGLKVHTILDIFTFMGNQYEKYKKFIKKMQKINTDSTTDILGAKYDNNEKILLLDNNKNNSYEDFGNNIIIMNDVAPYCIDKFLYDELYTDKAILECLDENITLLNDLITNINKGFIEQIFNAFYLINEENDMNENIIEFDTPKSVYEIYEAYYPQTKEFSILKKLVRKNDIKNDIENDLLLNIPRKGLPRRFWCHKYNNYMSDPTKYKNLYLPYWNFDKYNYYFSDIIFDAYNEKRFENKPVFKVSPEYYRRRRINLENKFRRAERYEIIDEKNTYNKIEFLNFSRDLDEDNEEYSDDIQNNTTVYDFIENKLN